MNKSTIISSVIAGILTSSLALASEGLKIKMEGIASFEGGGKSQVQPYKKDKLITQNNNDVGFNSAVNLGLRAEGTLDNNSIKKYGAIIKVSPVVSSNITSKSRAIDKSYLYIETDIGRFELGSNYTAGNMLRVSAGSLTMGEGGATGSWSDYANLSIPQISDPTKSEIFIKSENLYSDAHGSSLQRKEGKRQIAYYTPKYNNLQFGISYIPDAANHGDGTRQDANPLFKVAKNIVSGGVKYDSQIDEKLRVELGVVADYASGKLDTINGVSSSARKNLFSYVAGGVLNFDKFGIGVSYGNLGNSLVTKSAPEFIKKPYFYSIAGSYETSNYGLALSYFKSKINNRKLQAYSLSSKTRIAEGMTGYADITRFYQNANTTRPKNRGTTFLMGTKFNF